MTSPGSTLPVIINHHRYPSTASQGQPILQISAADGALVVDAFDIEEDDPSRAIAETLALAAATIHPEAAREMLGLEISVTKHTTELVLQAIDRPQPSSTESTAQPTHGSW